MHAIEKNLHAFPVFPVFGHTSDASWVKDPMILVRARDGSAGK
jgi:hypothetical protein